MIRKNNFRNGQVGLKDITIIAISLVAGFLILGLLYLMFNVTKR